MNIGILGGGQLARMMIEAVSKYDFRIYIYSTEKNSPAGRISHGETFGKWDDFSKLDKFIKKCDLITLENEFIDYHILEYIENSGVRVFPDSSVIKKIQDKYEQKKFLKESGIPVAEFCDAETEEDVIQFANKHKFPILLKSRTMGYDGKGNATVKSEDEIKDAFNAIAERGKVMCEKFINLKMELAIQAVRSREGEIKFYSPVETIQKNHICHLVIAPYNTENEQTEKIIDIAKTIVEKIDYVGVMGIELFLTDENKILVNELAPRVHNTGHYTIEGSKISQFENHIRAILGYPLGDTGLIFPYSVMINILGERDGKAKPQGYDLLFKSDNVFLHLYGKNETRKGRKMGHLTVNGTDKNDTIKKALKSREVFNI